MEDVVEQFRTRNGTDGVEHVQIRNWGHKWATAGSDIPFDTTGRVLERFDIEDTYDRLPDIE